MLGSVHRVLLVAYALLLGLVEGPAEVAAVLLVATTLAIAKKRTIRFGPAEIGILIWILAGLPGLLLDAGKHSSAETTRPLLALAFLIGAHGIDPFDASLLRKMAWAFGIACAINAAYGVLQFAVGELPWDGIFLENPRSGQIYIPGRVWHVRSASGLFYNRLKLAHVTMIGAFLVVMIALAPHAKKTTRAFAALGGLVMGAGVAFTYARMAFLAIVASFVALAAVLKRWLVIGAAALISIALLVAVPLSAEFKERIETLEVDLSIRRTMFEAAVEIFSGHPVFGVGHGVYRNALTMLGDRGLTGVHLTSPHNLWLQVLAETGIVGFVGFNAAVAWCLLSVVRRIRKGEHPSAERAILDRLALLGMLAILFVGLLHFSLHHAPVGLVFWTLAGVCVRTEEHGETA